MVLSELIAKVGDENVVLQWLDSSVVLSKVEGATGMITFATDPAIVLDRLNDTTEKVGVVVWVPRSRVAEIMKG